MNKEDSRRSLHNRGGLQGIFEILRLDVWVEHLVVRIGKQLLTDLGAARCFW
jgi:hypothetical protein